MKRHRSTPRRPRTRGRRYRTEVEITYTAGRLPAEVREALLVALAETVGDEAVDLSWSVSADQDSRLRVSVTLAADRPLAAVTRVDAALDDALAAKGLFELFDATGRALHVAPVDRVWRKRERPAGP